MASTYTVGAVLDTVEKKIQDESNADWSVSDLLNLYNLTLREIVKLSPRAYSVFETFKMVSGAKQSLPASGLTLIDVAANMGTDGATPGRSPRGISMQVLASYLPDWREETAVAEIKHFIPIPETPNQFWVFPQSDGTGYLQCHFSKTPPTTTYDADDNYRAETIPLSDEYLNGIINGMLYMAYDDDSDIPGNTPRSAMYYGRFLQSIGVAGGGQ